MHHQCQNSEAWFDMWERNEGPGQEGYAEAQAEQTQARTKAKAPQQTPQSAMSQFVCPGDSCEMTMSAPLDAAGAVVRCPKCETPFRFVKKDETTLVGERLTDEEIEAGLAPEKQDTAQAPPIARQAWNLATSLKNFVMDGFKTVTTEQYEERLTICDNCPDEQRIDNRCMACGCNLSLKARGRAFDCPRDYWPKIMEKAETS